jgi:hypothetical protein
MGKVSAVTWCFIGVIVAAAVAILLHVPGSYAPPGWWTIYACLALLFGICDSYPTQLATRQSAWSPSSVATLAAVVLLGPMGAAMVGAVAVLRVGRRVTIAERFFNSGMNAIAGYLAGVIYLAAGGLTKWPAALGPIRLSDLTHLGSLHGLGQLAPILVSLPASGKFVQLIWPFAAAAAIHVLTNHGLVRILLWTDRLGQPARPPADADSGRLLLLFSDFGYAALGLIVAGLWPIIGPFAAAIALVPLYVARWAMQQFAEQHRSYERTIATLCQAVETKDFYTRGHSDRVSRGARMIARQIGMRSDRIEAIAVAGMLHDVGKLGVPTKVLQKEGKLSEEEYAAIQLHPMRGLEIVREIGFLSEALAGIMHHHERMDGTGYPMGLAGAEIPEFARIISVADAFDSMTSTRSYRPGMPISVAVDRLNQASGTQFDPKIVSAFLVALDRERWEPPAVAIPLPEDILTIRDHDDPTAPLAVAETT